MPVTLLKSQWRSGNLCFEQISTTGDAAVYFGKDDYGTDVKFFGATSGSYQLWDQSADTAILYAANLNFNGTLASPKGLFNVDGSASYFADFAATAKGGLVLTADGMSQNPETASEDGFIRILAGASIYEIPIYLNT